MQILLQFVGIETVFRGGNKEWLIQVFQVAFNSLAERAPGRVLDTILQALPLSELNPGFLEIAEGNIGVRQLQPADGVDLRIGLALRQSGGKRPDGFTLHIGPFALIVDFARLPKCELAIAQRDKRAKTTEGFLSL